jgi:hypothetical protein
MTMRKKKVHHRYTEVFRYERAGKTYPCSFTVEDGWISFSTAYGSKQAQLHLSTPRGLLMILLSELGLQLVNEEAAS